MDQETVPKPLAISEKNEQTNSLGKSEVVFEPPCIRCQAAWSIGYKGKTAAKKVINFSVSPAVNLLP